MPNKPRNVSDVLVVVSFYDARPIEPLISLLRQLRNVPAGAAFDLLVVVNSVTMEPPVLPDDLGDIDILLRPNGGYNIGAWQHAWESRPGHDVYLFLQDDCVICEAGWLLPFLERAKDPEAGLIGEAQFMYFGWASVERLWAEVRYRYEAMRAEAGVPNGYGPSHVQMTVVAVHRSVLEAAGGFVTGNDKATANAGEILSSVRILHLGYRNCQVAWHPYTYILHPQWTAYIAKSRHPRWSLSRGVRLLVDRVMIEPGRRRRFRVLAGPPCSAGPADAGPAPGQGT